jgi:hypothetical protein
MATADGRFARETIGDTLTKSEISRPNWTGAAARGLRVPGSKRFDRLNPAQPPHEPGARSHHAGARCGFGAAGLRPAGRFVAHLIAGCLQAPQTRAGRRAEPADAIAAFGALGQWPTPARRVLSRAL